jgi:hypothetical protein
MNFGLEYKIVAPFEPCATLSVKMCFDISLATDVAIDS